MIDTGFAHDAAKARSRDLLRLPADAVRLDVMPKLSAV